MVPEPVMVPPVTPLFVAMLLTVPADEFPTWETICMKVPSYTVSTTAPEGISALARPTAPCFLICFAPSVLTFSVAVVVFAKLEMKG